MRTTDTLTVTVTGRDRETHSRAKGSVAADVTANGVLISGFSIVPMYGGGFILWASTDAFEWLKGHEGRFLVSDIRDAIQAAA